MKSTTFQNVFGPNLQLHLFQRMRANVHFYSTLLDADDLKSTPSLYIILWVPFHYDRKSILNFMFLQFDIIINQR